MTLNEAYEQYRCARTDENLELLYPLLKEKITRVVGKVTHEEPDEDIVSDLVVLVLYQRLENYDPDYVNPRTGKKTAFSTWVEDVARDHCIDVWRKRYRSVEESLEGLSPTEVKRLFSKQDLEKDVLLVEVFQQLTEEEKELLSGKLEGRKGVELADLLGVPEGTIKSRWANLKGKLMNLLPFSIG